MKKIILFFAVLVIVSCKSEESYTKATDAQEAAREFISASLAGNYDKANFYIYKDSAKVNEMLLNRWRDMYSKWSQEDKVGHKEANIIVITTVPINDSTLDYVYTNSYKSDTTTIRILRYKGEWLVDLKDIHK